MLRDDIDGPAARSDRPPDGSTRGVVITRLPVGSAIGERDGFGSRASCGRCKIRNHTRYRAVHGDISRDHVGVVQRQCARRYGKTTGHAAGDQSTDRYVSRSGLRARDRRRGTGSVTSPEVEVSVVAPGMVSVPKPLIVTPVPVVTLLENAVGVDAKLIEFVPAAVKARLKSAVPEPSTNCNVNPVNPAMLLVGVKPAAPGPALKLNVLVSKISVSLIAGTAVGVSAAGFVVQFPAVPHALLTSPCQYKVAGARRSSSCSIFDRSRFDFLLTDLLAGNKDERNQWGRAMEFSEKQTNYFRTKLYADGREIRSPNN